MNGVGGDANIGLAIVGQHEVAAVGITGTAREIAAGHVDFNTMAGADGMAYVPEVDRQLLYPTRYEMPRLARQVAIHGAGHPVH